MQKVITIYSLGTQSTAISHKELDALLEQGYKVKQVLSANSEGFKSSVTLLLEKDS